MTKAENTRRFIIERSAPVFNKKGYAGTSLADLVAITGLTKGAIYGNFNNKDEVAVAVYEYNTGILRKKLDAAIGEKNTVAEKMEAFVAYYRSQWESIAERGGCPILNASIEADDNLPCLQVPVQRSIALWMKRIGSLIKKGKETGECRTSADPAAYAATVVTLIEGGIMLAKIMKDPEYLFKALDRIMAIYYQEIGSGTKA